MDLARSKEERLDPEGIPSEDKRLFPGGESFPEEWSWLVEDVREMFLSFRENDLLLRGLGA